jgi:hypothetical protein
MEEGCRRCPLVVFGGGTCSVAELQGEAALRHFVPLDKAEAGDLQAKPPLLKKWNKMQQTKRGRTMLDIGEITLRGAHDHGDLTPSRGSSSAILGSLWGTFSAGGGRPEEITGRLGCSGPPPHHEPPQGGEEAGNLLHRATTRQPPRGGEKGAKVLLHASGHLGRESGARSSSYTQPEPWR